MGLKSKIKKAVKKVSSPVSNYVSAAAAIANGVVDIPSSIHSVGKDLVGLVNNSSGSEGERVNFIAGLDPRFDEFLAPYNDTSIILRARSTFDFLFENEANNSPNVARFSNYFKFGVLNNAEPKLDLLMPDGCEVNAISHFETRVASFSALSNKSASGLLSFMTNNGIIYTGPTYMQYEGEIVAYIYMITNLNGFTFSSNNPTPNCVVISTNNLNFWNVSFYKSEIISVFDYFLYTYRSIAEKVRVIEDEIKNFLNQIQ